MFIRFSLLLSLLCALSVFPKADVLIVADEFPAMEYLAKQLKAQEGVTSSVVAQKDLPKDLTGYSAVAVYIHQGLAEEAEHAFIQYAEGGGRLVLLHHSISSGKRQNRSWFPFLGVELRQGDVDQGGYKWIEDVRVDWLDLSSHFIMTNRVDYSGRFAYASSSSESSKILPGFTLAGTEVYLNHVLTGPHTPLLGLHYIDSKTGKTWLQQTAGWLRPAGKGWVIYFMPGHTIHDFENPTYGRIVLNAITASPDHLR
jgi:hypothetical protein